MTDTGLGLLAAICTNPDDDDPRLQYADWLEGDARPVQPERAEFIRVQVELVALVVATDMKVLKSGARLAYLRRRDRELLAEHWHPWSGVRGATYCSNFGGDGAVGVGFRRGFAHSLTLPWNLWAGGPCGRCLVADAGCNYCSHIGQLPGVASALYWRLRPCPECKGTRGYAEPRGLANGGERGIDCPRCSGSGRVVPAVACPTCKGEIVVYEPAKWARVPRVRDITCSDCRDTDGIPTGRVPRPCPAGTQPIERVVFTTVPPMADLIPLAAKNGIDIERVPRERGREIICKAEWPGVKFTLPAVDPRETVDLGRRGVS